MCEDKPYFADARVGDSVYEMQFGPGKIIGIEVEDIPDRPLLVAFANGYIRTFTKDGYKKSQIRYQTLFYSKPVFKLPPPPKRTVKKVIEGWVNIYEGLVPTKAECDSYARENRLGDAHFIRHEYEVEE